jgi:hypothetical protein
MPEDKDAQPTITVTREGGRVITAPIPLPVGELRPGETYTVPVKRPPQEKR